MPVVATAGHVDHGKSTLVRALTGTDPDRLAEEKDRGLTIDLGFAHHAAVGREVGFVDVPGHVRFIKNMLAGVGAVDACLFVVAATEGWKPQSEEHLRILELLGLAPRRGGPDQGRPGADETWSSWPTSSWSTTWRARSWRRAEVVDVDAPAGLGVDDLGAALDRLVGDHAGRRRPRPAPAVGRPGLRGRGSGTVVTGTLAGGALARRRRAVLLPAAAQGPGPGPAEPPPPQARVEPGRRVAVNLGGVGHTECAGATCWCGPGSGTAPAWSTPRSPCSTASTTPCPAGAPTWPTWARASCPSGCGCWATTPSAPATTGPVRLHLPLAVPLLPGDRFVLREIGPPGDRGRRRGARRGPRAPAASARPDRSVDRVVAERGWVDADELERLTGERVTPTSAAGWSTPAAWTRRRPSWPAG